MDIGHTSVDGYTDKINLQKELNIYRSDIYQNKTLWFILILWGMNAVNIADIDRIG